MESKKLEKPRENGTFSTVQGVMKPDEEGRRVFCTMKGIVLMYFLSETDTIKRVKCFRKKVTGQCPFYSIKKIIL